MNAAPYPADVEFQISRTLDAPRDAIWRAWSEAERLAQWWGPKGMPIRVATLDFKPDGIFHYAMKMPTGGELWGKFIYRDIKPPETIVFTNGFADADGHMIRAPFSATWPLKIINTVTFDEQDGKTIITLRGGPVDATPDELQTFKMGHASMQAGFGGTFDQLAAYVTKNEN